MTNHEAISGQIVLIDAQGRNSPLQLENCLELAAPDGAKLTVKYDGKGGFSAQLPGDGPYRLRANFGDEKHVFAFDTQSTTDQMPQTEIAVKPGQRDIQLFGWALQEATPGQNPQVDAQFERDTAAAESAVKSATASTSAAGPAIPCRVCQSRYYTPGTPYYMNYPAYQKCVSDPPCT